MVAWPAPPPSNLTIYARLAYQAEETEFTPLTDAPNTLAGLQKLNVKLPIDVPPGFDYDVLLSIFGRWRLDPNEEIMDLSDYGHVDHGPNCLLVSHRWHFGIDVAGGEPGFFLSVRTGLSGSPAERVKQAVRLLLEKSKRLCAEAELPRTVRPRCEVLEIVLNDRLLAPHTPATDATWRPAVESLSTMLYGAGRARLEKEKDPSRRLGYRLTAPEAAPSLEELLRRLG